MTVPIAVTIDSPAWKDRVPGCVADAVRWSKAALNQVAPNLGDAEISITLTDGNAIRTLNAQYRGIDKPTNVLSFPAFSLIPGMLPPQDAPRPLLLGDIVLAIDVLEEEVAAGRRDGDGPRCLEAHFAHLVVHGVLHLFGYDHQSDPEACEMEALETALLAELDFPDPYTASGAPEKMEHPPS